MYEHELPGLAGDNLLAFLAALGTLRVLSSSSPEAADAADVTALSWRERGGTWLPVIHHASIETRAALTEELANRCCLHEPTKRRQILAAAEQRLHAHKQKSKSALDVLKGSAKREAKKRADAEQTGLQTAVVEARAAWRAVEDVLEERRAERNKLKAEAEKAAAQAEQAEKDAPLRLKKTDDAAEVAARMVWQSQLDDLRRKADFARRAWLNAVAALVPIPAFSLGDNLTVTSEEFAKFARQAAAEAQPASRDWADYTAAFGCELYPTETGVIQDTRFRTMSGAGHQHFLGTMVKLYEEATPDNLARSLFDSWEYSDVGLSLRWDAADDRRYALRFYDPGNANASPSLTVRGANRLATEALPLFPAFIVGERLQTTGFVQREKKTAITWPMWISPLGLDPIRSLLSLAELQTENLSRTKLELRGVLQLYRAVRFREGKFYNFSPAQELL